MTTVADLNVAAGAVRYRVESALDATDPPVTTHGEARAVADIVLEDVPDEHVTRLAVVEGWTPSTPGDRVDQIVRVALAKLFTDRNERQERTMLAVQSIAGDLAWWLDGGAPLSLAAQAVQADQVNDLERAAQVVRDARAALERAGVR